MKVGVIGLGSMGSTHLDVYAKRTDVEVVAVADLDEKRRTGEARATGNVEGQAQGTFDFASVRKYAEASELIADPEVELVDICVPTPGHLQVGLMAMEAGKHVLIEKPLARTAEQGRQLAAAAAKSPGMTMCAMCMRFWPGWTWLKDVIDRSAYGAVRAATFRRVADHPGGRFYEDGDACGGALLDLHIHDSDFIQYAFGMPQAVTSHGYTKISGGIDHVVTHYHYPDAPLIMAEGGWAMAKGFGFQMQYTVNFERATAVFDLAAPQPLVLYEAGNQPAAVPIEPALGYELEIDYFLKCIARGERPSTVTLESAAESLRLIEAELQSIQTGQKISLAAG